MRDFRDAVVKLSLPFTQYGISTFDCFAEDSPQKGQGLERSIHAYAAIAQDMQCRDAIDKVYSLLGVIDVLPWNQMSTNYNKSTSWVFAEATWLSLRMSHDYDVLLNAWDATSPAVPADLPSWAFDYENGFFYGFPPSIEPIFDIKLGIRLPKALPYINDDHTQLSLAGLSLECMEHAGQAVATADTPNLSPYELFVAMAGALAAFENWQLVNFGLRENERRSRPAWPPAGGSNAFTIEHEFLINADAWKDILPTRQTHAELLSTPGIWASCTTVFLTAGRHWGLMTGSCASGDVVFVVKGCPYPLIIRKQEEVYMFRGCAYIPAFWSPRFGMSVVKAPHEMTWCDVP